MHAELVAVGSELLRFGRRDTNGDWLTDRLQRHGVEVTRRWIVGDDLLRLQTTIVEAVRQSDLVVLTGGLGPTADDRTREALARAIGCSLERDGAQLERLRQMFERWGRPFRPEQAKQADRPVGSQWIANGLGTAPGIFCEFTGAVIVALPGVPAEMKRMFEESVVPWLAARGAGNLARRTLKIGGRLEASVDRQLSDLYGLDGVEVTILAGGEGIELQLMARGASPTDARRRLGGVEREIRRRLGDDLIGEDDETLALVVGRRLQTLGLTLATAESCTAGMLAASVTDVPGSSVWFRGGVVVYHDDLKQSMAGVPRKLLESHGAVSEPVARALAEGVRLRCGADIGIAVTGIAGPGGGTDDKPVGRVHIALAERGGTEHWKIRQVGDRQLIRRRTVAYVLDRLRRSLQGRPGPA